ncbi:MAG: phosphoserine phosphatase SerB [Paludibacteraceae bacterium]|nr:phosphoserine phosphatase SerB [Paludibacteraceae bacterium]
MESCNIILLSVFGDDKPGVTATMTGILGKYNAEILDIGQADIHHFLALGILFKIDNDEQSPILKDLLFKGYEIGVKVRFTPITLERYQQWVNRQGKSRYVVTILGKIITAKQLSLVSSAIAKQNLNIDSIKRLTGRPPVDRTNIENLNSCVELSVRGNLKSKTELSATFLDISATEGIDISFQKDDIYRRTRRLICFDMDSTLIKTEVIDELADRAGVGDKVRKITESAMRGEIDFKESFKRRVALLKGLDENVMKNIAENLPIMDGAERLMKVLKKSGFKIAILSGGFSYFGEYLKNRFGVDYVYANNLEIKDGKLTGRYIGDIVDGKRKAELLKLIAQVEHIELEQVIAVGDGANDLPMINLAGLGIAFHAKPKVKANASQSISTIGLDGILYFLGFRDIHIEN